MGEMTLTLTNRDHTKIATLLDVASTHISGGRYNMVAAWVKGKRSVIGMNTTDRPAATAVDSYPDICGIHAELDVWMRCRAVNLDMRGGTIYVVGRKAVNNNQMNTTKPCLYCRAILSSTQVRNVIYFDEGRIHKIPAPEFW